MNKLKFNKPDSSQDLELIMMELWKNKIIIFFFIALCLLVTYFFQIKNLERYYKSEIVISKPLIDILPEYHILIRDPKFNTSNLAVVKNKNFNDIFFITFLQLLLSSENFQNFIDESDDFKEFKSYINKNRRNLHLYLKGKIGFTKDNDKIFNKDYDNVINFYLIHHESLRGDIFINNYANYTAKKVLLNIKVSLNELIVNEISHYEKELKISTNINKSNDFIKFVRPENYPLDKLPINLMGEEVLNAHLKSMNILLKNLENIKINYDPVFIKSTSREPISRNIIAYLLFSIIFGFIFSLVFIYFNSFLKKLKIK